jgi:hypothetical protein
MLIALLLVVVGRCRPPHLSPEVRLAEHDAIPENNEALAATPIVFGMTQLRSAWVFSVK